jgi:hypothetical protein
MADEALQEQLRALGQGLAVRVPDDLADRVLDDLTRAPVKRHASRRRWSVALATLLVGAIVSGAASAPVRAAFIELFGFGGVELHPAPGPSPAAIPVLPGEHRTDIDSAQREVGFRVRIPSLLGEPEMVTVADGRVVSLHYTLPTGAVRIDQFSARFGLMWTKYADQAAQRTAVGAFEALWFEGPVTLIYRDARGIEQTESARQTTGTLLWRDGELTFRIDGVRPLDAALAVARSMS